MTTNRDPAQAPRIMMYSQDGFGLGHMRRTSLIASQLLQTRADACILTLADSPLGQFFDTKRNHDYLKLPSIVKVGPGAWRPVSLPLPFDDVLAMRQRLIQGAVSSFQPDILLVDHMPHGAMGELLPTLEAIRSSGAPTKVVLGLRDILDAPEVVRRRWQEEGAYDAIERFYDAVLVYGRREVFDLAAHYGFTPAVSARLRYCGYVCNPDAPRYLAKIRAQYLGSAAGSTKLIVAMAGGGADAYPMMRALLDAFPAVRAEHPCSMLLITGPFMPPEQRRDLEARSRGLTVWVKRSVSDTLSYIEAADLTVAMAGYNTTMEILRSGRRAILIPRAGPSAEQRMRASLFGELGWVKMLDPDNLEPAAVAQELAANLDAPLMMSYPMTPDLQGVRGSVDHLLALIAPEAVGGPAPQPAR